METSIGHECHAAWLAAASTRRVNLLVALGAALIGVPLVLTLYLSLFDEKLILFPPRGYTLSWYPAIIPHFGGRADQPATGLAAVAGSLLLGIPAGIGAVPVIAPGAGDRSPAAAGADHLARHRSGLAVYIVPGPIDSTAASALSAPSPGWCWPTC